MKNRLRFGNEGADTTACFDDARTLKFEIDFGDGIRIDPKIDGELPNRRQLFA